jgi:hypothetical protein
LQVVCLTIKKEKAIRTLVKMEVFQFMDVINQVQKEVYPYSVAPKAVMVPRVDKEE